MSATLGASLAGAVDPVSGLAGHRVWLFSGDHDEKVPAPVTDALQAYYRRLGVTRIARVRGILDRNGHPRPAGHAMPTLEQGNACDTSQPPYINRCEFDAAGRMLQWLYPDLARRGRAGPAASLSEFDQAEFLDRRLPHGIDARGLAYIPSACRQAGARCRLHVAFHGCRQGRAYPMPDGTPTGDRFATLAGYNEWAEAGRIVVLYPQIAAPGADARVVNPRGCWDFWGYTGPDFAVRTGRQIQAVRRMVERLLARP